MNSVDRVGHFKSGAVLRQQTGFQLLTTRLTNVNLLYFPDNIEISSLEGLNTLVLRN